MLFGIEEFVKDNGSLFGWIGGATALLIAAAQAIVLIYNTYSDRKVKTEQIRHNNQQETMKSQQDVDTRAIVQWIQVSERLQKQVDRLDSHTKDQAEAIFLLHQDHADCQAELNNLYNYVDYIYDTCCRILRTANKLGLDDDKGLPVKPERKPRKDRGDLEFKMRTLQQRQETLSQKTEEMNKNLNSTDLPSPE